MLDESLASFDLKKLADAIDSKRDLKFGYLGLQTLYDRYFLHVDEKRIEPPSPSQDEHQECVAAGATAAGLPDWVKESYLKAGKGIPQQPKPYVGYGCD